jgi:SWIRM-associated region 1
LIYKVFSKSVDNSKALQKVQKQKMKKIVSLLIYLQMRKIEMKLMYFNEFEKIIQYDSQQLKSKESQALQDRLKLVFKKADIMTTSNKFKEIAAQFKESSEKFDLKDINKINDIKYLIEEAVKLKIDNSENLLDLN